MNLIQKQVDATNNILKSVYKDDSNKIKIDHSSDVVTVKADSTSSAVNSGITPTVFNNNGVGLELLATKYHQGVNSFSIHWNYVILKIKNNHSMILKTEQLELLLQSVSVLKTLIF